ncbi:MAG: hypothetical protein RBS57_04785 [Desulforhabdus sp.]|nr:hypothetical protein [Desulforhabdus sp.]
MREFDQHIRWDTINMACYGKDRFWEIKRISRIGYESLEVDAQRNGK